MTTPGLALRIGSGKLLGKETLVRKCSLPLSGRSSYRDSGGISSCSCRPYLVLAPLGLLALVVGRGARGTLDLPLDHGRCLFDLVSPSAPFRFEHVFSLFGFQIRPYTPPRGFIKPVFRGCITKKVVKGVEIWEIPHIQ